MKKPDFGGGVNFRIFRRHKKWRTLDGRIIVICDLTDDHLANIIHHVVNHPTLYLRDTVCWLHREAEYRGLTIEYLDKAPYPYVSKP